MSAALLPGPKLGCYEIHSPIGAGGMGEAYLTQDPTLDRKVALEAPPENVASNRNRMQRFVQEAKAASALNHVNIITIYEIGTEPGAHFMATEFIDGETQPQKLKYLQDQLMPITEGLWNPVDIDCPDGYFDCDGCCVPYKCPDLSLFKAKPRARVLSVSDSNTSRLPENWTVNLAVSSGQTRSQRGVKRGYNLCHDLR